MMVKVVMKAVTNVVTNVAMKVAMAKHFFMVATGTTDGVWLGLSIVAMMEVTLRMELMVRRTEVCKSEPCVPNPL